MPVCVEVPAKRGYECELWLGGLLIGYATDNTPDFDSDKLEVTSRNSNASEESMQGIHRITDAISAAIWVPSDAGIQAIQAAYWNRTLLTWRVVDSNGYGWEGCVWVKHWTPSPRTLESAVLLSVDLIVTGQVVEITPSS